MPFEYLAEVSFRRGRKCVLLQRTEQPASRWIGAFYFAPTGIQLDGTVTELLDAIQPASNIENLGFIVLRQPVEVDRLEEFANAMLTARERFPERGQAYIGGFVLWLDQLGAFEIGQVPAFTMPRDPVTGPAREGPTSYRLEPDVAQRVYDPSGSGRLLSLHAADLRSATLGPKGDDDGLSFVLGGSLPLRAASGGEVAGLSALSIDFTGDHAGCVIMQGAVGSGFRVLEPGFQHELRPAAGFGQDSDAAPGRLFHPLLDPAETLEGTTADLVLDPLAPADSARNTVRLAPAGGSFGSAYRTRLAEVVRLAPGADAYLQAATTRDDRIYFAPAGTFTLSVADGDPAPLVGGLSGVEYIAFANGDHMVFVPGQRAVVDYDDADGITFTSTDAEGRQVSWAAIAASSGTPETEIWVSESERSPLFASPGGEATADPIGFLPVAQRSVPTDVDAAKASPYPLLPYAAVAQMADGPGASSDVIRAFELSFISPRRRQVLLGLTGRPSGESPAVTHALTPQGYVATLKDGRMTGLTLGRIDRDSGSQGGLSFDGGDQELPAELRDAFFSNQQFIVMTAATEAVASMQATADLSGWVFSLDLPAPADVVPGDYRTVLVIKSAGPSVEELARQPEAWTGYEHFNNAQLDPTGEILSGWITTYIEEAKSLYDGGKGVVGLRTFIEVVTNPGWNGFVFLRVPVDTGALDPAIQFLLAGVDRDAFDAHHVGCAVNHAALEDGAYQPNSAFFGLVHYVRPGTEPGKVSSNPFVPSNRDYDFQLLLLDATFESSIITDFTSTARLVANRLFGDAISSTSPDPEVTATNALLVYGSLQNENGVPRYAFATGEGATASFFPISAGFERIELDRARISLETGGGDDTDVARFDMSGWLALGDRGEGFDLLGYAGIPFEGLVLSMTFPVGEGSGRATTYALDTTGVTLGRLPERELADGERVTVATVASEVVYRPHSLASQLPVTATRLVTGKSGQSPIDLGYGDLVTTPSTGTVSFDGPWYGLELALPLGSAGALGSGSLLTARMLLAWPGGGKSIAYDSFFRLEGPGGANLKLELQGVLELGANAIFLTRTDEDQGGQYVLQLSSIGLTVLTKTFPPAGSTNVYLAGFTDDSGRRTLGWFGAYVADA